MTGELIQRTDLTQYGLGSDYSCITIGDLQLYAAKVNVHFNDYVTMTVEYRGAQDDIRGNLVLTSGGVDQETALAQMKHTLDAYIGGRS